MGRAKAIERLRERQQALLEFASQLTVAKDKEHVCRRLAEFLRRELHGEGDPNGKATVRLTNPIFLPCPFRNAGKGWFDKGLGRILRHRSLQRQSVRQLAYSPLKKLQPRSPG